MKKEIIEWIKALGSALVFSMIIIAFARPTVVDGPSMLPTLEDHDLLVVNQISYLMETPVQGDIVVFQSDLLVEGSETEKKRLIKRVIGVKGDEVVIHDGLVLVNGRVLEESYLPAGLETGPNLEVVVPEGMLFVMGDNRSNSKDSRSQEVGLVALDRVMGKAYFKLYPLNQLGALR